MSVECEDEGDGDPVKSYSPGSIVVEGGGDSCHEKMIRSPDWLPLSEWVLIGFRKA